MIIEDSIKIKNYKCFGKEPQGFERICPINVIIGKNNSGKSSLIEVIQFLGTRVRENYIQGIEITHMLEDKELIKVFPTNTSGGAIPSSYPTHYSFGQTLIGNRFTYTFNYDLRKTAVSMSPKPPQIVEPYFSKLAEVVSVPMKDKIFKHVTAERDIVPELDSDSSSSFDWYSSLLKPNGEGATQLIQSIIVRTDFDKRLIDKEFLNELNGIVGPDIEFRNIFAQKRNSTWEIYFEDKNEVQIPLSKMGSGIKTIMLVLLNLIVVHKIEKKEKSKYLFAFEELENNLHPSLLRRLFAYISKYSQENQVYFFITTHSNIVIDFFGSDNNAQIIHVVNDGKSSTCKTVESVLHNKQILRDLDVRASDLLQSNGIIWVEGPSDRVYINKWISLMAPELREGEHYSILFYGGRLLSNMTFDFHWLEEELIPLLKINLNAFVVIDRDGESVKAAVNKTKQRIQSEIGEDNCWITKGREIENYLSDDLIVRWIKHDFNINAKVTCDINVKLEDNIRLAKVAEKVKYDNDKKGNSLSIVNVMSLDDLDTLDLKKRLSLLVNAIRGWNAMAVS